ncbi:MAG: hypothetical protein QOI37_1589 [Chloroflexota bacterium]|nr:hypothetical protein [Chloroflexota bacterium]
MQRGNGTATDDPAPAGRVGAFDLARGLAVAFMILVHVLRHWGDPSTWTTPIGNVISTLGGPPAAPVFVFLMGASLAFSRRTSFAALASRGLWLIAAGYLLDLLRGTLPLELGLATGVVTMDQVAPFTPFSLLTTVDILQLAGCSLVVMAALRRVMAPGPGWLVVAAAIVLVAPALHGRTTGFPVADALLGMVWQTTGTVYYPIFPWAAFPLVGAVVGEMLLNAGDRRAVLRRLGLLGLAAATLGAALVSSTAVPLDIATYWRLPPVLALAILGFVLAWIWACDVVSRSVGERFGLGAVYRWSGRVTSMYVIHWLIISWGVAIVGFRVLPLVPTLLGAVAVLLATILISRWRPRLPGIPSQAASGATPEPSAGR